MLKNLKRKFAKVALIVLALQLVFVGVGFAPKAATAAAGDFALTAVGGVGNYSAPELATVDSLGNTIMTKGAGDAAYFSSKLFASVEVTLTQPVATSLYSGKVYVPPVYAAVKDLQLWAYSQADGLWFDVNKSGYGDPAGTPIALFVGTTVKVYPVSNVEGTYHLPINLVDAVDKTSVIASAVDDVTVKSPYTLSVTPLVSLGNKAPAEPTILDGDTKNTFLGSINPVTGATYLSLKSYKKFDVTLSKDLTAPDYLGKVRMAATLVPGIQVWTFVPNANPLLSRWIDVNQSGLGDLAGVDITQFSGQTISYYVVSETEGIFPVNFNLVDVTDKTVVATLRDDVLVDATAPVITMTSKPVIVSDTKKTIEVTFSAKESIVLNSPFVTFTQGTKVFSGKPATQSDTTKVVVYTTADFFDGGVTPIDVTATFADLSGNLAPFAGQIKVDTIAPAAVTGVTTLVNPDGSVTLSWVNPPVGTFSGLRIVRVGDFTVTVSATVMSYTDNTTEKGKTYEYSIVAFDEAGNETATAPVSVTVPAPVIAAAVSDTANPAPTNTNTDTEVKANVTDDNAKKDDTGFPVWGIILLVLLALVGGYLIWNQKPALEPVATLDTKKKTNSTKKK